MANIGEYLSDWRVYIPFYIAFYRWALYLLCRIVPALFYRQLKYIPPKRVNSTHYVNKEDVTVVVTAYDPPDCFEDTIKSVLNNNPYEVIVVADKSCYVDVTNRCARFHNVRVINENQKGKRPALATGVMHTRTKIVALVDDDIRWCDTFLEKLLAPFQQNENIGGVGCKHVARVRGICDFWRIMADMRLAVRFLELMATTSVDKGASCISGRTAAYRTHILQNEEFYDYLTDEYFFGMKLLSGDDKCITRFIMNKGWYTYHQLRNTCSLSTTFEDGIGFFTQMLRWSRNTWRSDIKALFIERYVWTHTPFTAFVILDKMFTPFFMIYGITFLPVNAIMNNNYAILITWYAWVIITRFLKLIYYFWDCPSHIIYLPIFVVFQYVQAFVKVWALFTLSNRNWGTRSVAMVGNQAVNVGEDHKSEPEYELELEFEEPALEGEQSPYRSERKPDDTLEYEYDKKICHHDSKSKAEIEIKSEQKQQPMNEYHISPAMIEILKELTDLNKKITNLYAQQIKPPPPPSPSPSPSREIYIV